MYQCGDRVLYGIHGVCTITAIEEQVIDRKRVEYYILEPLAQPGARFLVPTKNETAVAKLRRILSQQELTQLLHCEQIRGDAWIDDEGKRKQRYRDLISSGDRVALLSMVNTLHRHKQEQAAAGRKFHLCDENFLRDAERLLNSEFSLVLDIAPSEVGEYVLNAIQGE